MEKEMTNDDLKAQFEIYLNENDKFVNKGIKASATKARKALAEIIKLSKERRVQILEEKEAMSKN